MLLLSHRSFMYGLHLSGNLALADVITLTRTAAALETRHKAFPRGSRI